MLVTTTKELNFTGDDLNSLDDWEIEDIANSISDAITDMYSKLDLGNTNDYSEINRKVLEFLNSVIREGSLSYDEESSFNNYGMEFSLDFNNELTKLTITKFY